MKIALSVAVFCVVLGLISSESCTTTSDCQVTNCDGGTVKGCQHGICSCYENHHTCDNSNTCSLPGDCSSCQCPQMRAHHCLDGHCMCFSHRPDRPIGK